MFYTPSQLVVIAQNAGFPYPTALKMAAIAMRESRGDPNALFTGPASKPNSEYSVGLWQINMKNAPERLALFGVTSAEQLKDPALNAHAAYVLWAGNDANLARHWAINTTGPPYYYAENFQKFYADVLAAVGGPAAPGTISSNLPTGGGGSVATDSTPAFWDDGGAFANYLAGQSSAVDLVESVPPELLWGGALLALALLV